MIKELRPLGKMPDSRMGQDVHEMSLRYSVVPQQKKTQTKTNKQKLTMMEVYQREIGAK